MLQVEKLEQDIVQDIEKMLIMVNWNYLPPASKKNVQVIIRENVSNMIKYSLKQGFDSRPYTQGLLNDILSIIETLLPQINWNSLVKEGQYINGCYKSLHTSIWEILHKAVSEAYNLGVSTKKNLNYLD
jgi:hypothetical protein